MPAGIPATDMSFAIKQLNQMVKDKSWTSFQLRRIENQAKTGMDIDPAEAHVVLGIIASLRGQTDKIHEHFRVALQFPKNMSLNYVNYSIALRWVGLITEAFSMADKGAVCFPDDKMLLREAIDTAFGSGHFLRANDLVNNQWTKLSPDASFQDRQQIEKSAEWLQSRDMSEKCVSSLVEIAFSIARERLNFHKSFNGIQIDVLADGTDQFLAYDILINETPEIISNLNEEFIDASLDSVITERGFVLSFESGKVKQNSANEFAA
ncbi:hypothetical protein [Acidithiobacillus sp.]|uniref:hypothetical protein n=1 Tax=Acidithiobacillus sp. TaxID=1872118 RepID=UPI001D2C9FDD|nr:hypothetical protein [Acidithiobacillus sp.]MBN2899673.1 hypothetical protein [Clostridia bacterium]MDD5280448.1 hypothetical protein [Acidithiobacillus sp.]